MAFGEEAIRLLREKWPNATMLAEEAFAVFRSWKDKGLSGPLIVNQTNPSEPAIQVRRSDPSSSYVPAIQVVTPGKSDPGNVVTDEDLPLEPSKQPEGEEGGSGSQSVFPGVVLAKISGQVYRVQIFTALDGTSSQVVEVRQLYIADGEEIPAGSWIPGGVIQLEDESYVMQFPVWL